MALSTTPTCQISSGFPRFLSGVVVLFGACSPRADETQEAALRSLELLQSSATSWTREAQCFSCHHQGLGALAIALGAERGLDPNPAARATEARAVHDYARRRIERLLTNDGAGVFSRSLSLVALGTQDVPRDLVTDLLAHYLAARQHTSGAWPSNEHRPPMEDSSVSATAWTLRALALYGPEGRAAEMERRLARGASWLESVEPRDTEERVMQILGLSWCGRAREALAPLARALAAEQREDGGWAQLPTLESDAYATGQALVALHTAGWAGEDERRRGVAFLLETQAEDGSWYVRTRRRIPGQTQVDSRYPYEEDQFIAYMAGVWATSALLLDGTVERSRTWHGPAPDRGAGAAPFESSLRGLARTALLGTVDELRERLAAGDDPNEPGPRGLSPLMLAVHDPAKVEALLAAGADPDAVSKAGYTPVLFASMTGGARGSLDLLLDAGATVEADVEDLAGPLYGAVSVGDLEAFDALLAAGAELDERNLARALGYAATIGDVATARRLLAAGADPDALGLLDHSALMSAVIVGSLELVDLLLEAGADVETPDPSGWTALAWAARVDPGHTRIVERLLEAGADPNAPSLTGRTPLEQAQHFGHDELARVLRAAPSR